MVCWSLAFALIKLSLGEFLGGSSIFCHLLRTGDPWEPRNWLRRSDGERLNPREEEDAPKVLLNPGRERRGESEGIPFGILGERRALWIGFCSASRSQYVVTFPFPWNNKESILNELLKTFRWFKSWGGCRAVPSKSKDEALACFRF